MKKLFVLVALFSGAMLFTSCGDDFAQNVFDMVSGNANVTYSEGNDEDFSSSIVMYDREASHPYALGVSMNMDIDQLLNTTSADQIQFPCMAYRLVGSEFSSGTDLTVNNVLTEAELNDFSYQSLMNGRFAENHVVGIALNEHQFYVMSTGQIHIAKVNISKIEGSFEGNAYLIDVTNGDNPTISTELYPISGSFKSRVIPMLPWLANLQSEMDE